jgi:hypothetical protein
MEDQGIIPKKHKLQFSSWMLKMRSSLRLRQKKSLKSKDGDYSKQTTFSFAQNGKILRVLGKKIGQIAGCTGAISDSLVIKGSSLRHPKVFFLLFYSQKMLQCIRTLREEVPNTQDDTSPAKRFVECLVAWETSGPSNDTFAERLRAMDVPFKVILAGISESALSVEELDLTVVPLIQRVDGKCRWQRESFWTERGLEIPDPDGLVQPGSVEAHILIWLASFHSDFLSLLIMGFVPFYAGKSIFVTDSGQLGYGDAAIHLSDSIYLIAGTDTPFIIRVGKETNRLMGWAYMDGVMMGECWPDDQSVLQTIELS